MRFRGTTIPAVTRAEALPKRERLTAEVRELRAQLERAHRRLAEAESLARVGSWEWDIVADVVTWSDELYRIYGLEPQSLVPTYERFLERVHPDDRDSVDERNRTAFTDHQPFEDVKRVVRPDGSEFLMRTQGEVICDEHGALVRMLGVCEDVTAEVQAREARELLASIVRSSADAIYTVAANGLITTWNPGAERLFGYTEHEAVGEPATILVPDSESEDDRRLMEAALAAEAVAPLETTRRRRDGGLVDVSVAMSPVMASGDRAAGFSVIARDITERRRFELQLRHMADHDSLSGLFNRRRFDEELERAVAHAARYRQPGALLMLDIDGFKYVNDSFGHGAGDEVIRAICGTLAERVRETDVIARLGGDEVAVLLPYARAEEVQSVAADLLRAVRELPIALSGRGIRVTASIGAVTFDAEARDAATLLAAADRAMYAAKDAGRDRVVIQAFDAASMADAAPAWEHRIRDALENDRFVLHCQPILDLARDEVSRYEVLLRMRDDDERLIPPVAFLGVAERLGLIHDIDRWVTRRAAELAAAHPEVCFEVNISGRSMDDPDLVTTIRRELDRTGAHPHQLVFEITETATIANIADARRFAEALTSMGCRFAIDDFGAGFGAFFYLKHLPVAYLKIDGDFVRSPRTRTDELVIDAIVGMSKGLGKKTIAEWVGDEETLMSLAAAGVDFAQGYHVGRPFPASDL